MKAPKIGINVHIPGSKKAKVPALKKLGAPEDAVNGRITAQPSKEQVCRPLPLPLPARAERANGRTRAARPPLPRHGVQRAFLMAC